MRDKYPKNDPEFRDFAIIGTDKSRITVDDGWSIGVSKCSIESKVGMIARFYGKGIGFPVRGLLME